MNVNSEIFRLMQEQPIERDINPLLEPGTLVSHFKRDLIQTDDPAMYVYRVICVATHSETQEPMVVYQACYGDRLFYCRPLSMFVDKVDKQKYPDAKQKWRFERIWRNEVP